MGKSESPPEDLVSVLRTTKNRLAYLSQNDWALIIDKAKRVRFSKNETLIQQGKQTKVVYLLAKGKVNIDVSRSKVAQIGPAGEHLVRFACIANDLNEVAGRTGMGAVMGSKRLKAIAVRGHGEVKLADKPGLLAIAKWVSATMNEKHRSFHEFGTGAAMQGKNLEGGMPVLNYRMGAADSVAKVDAIAVRDQLRVKMTSCYSCSVRCKKVVHVEQQEAAARAAEQEVYQGRARVAVDPRYRIDPRYGGPEYESLASLGVNLGLDDLIAVCKSNEMCNYLGMDTVSLGATLAWAMECFEKGLLTLDDTGGVPLQFHDADAVVKLIEMVAYRRGVGDLLADGSQRASQRVGRGSDAFLTTVKGLEMAMHATFGKAGAIRQAPDALFAVFTNRVNYDNALAPQSHGVGPCSGGLLKSWMKSVPQSTRSTPGCPALGGSS